MSRRNQGAKLRYLEDRGAFYITWTVNGRSRKLSTGTASSEDAQNIFAEWLESESEQSAQVIQLGPLTDILADYITERGPKVIGQDTMARAVETLARLWECRTVAEVPTHVDAYVKRGDRAVGN